MLMAGYVRREDAFFLTQLLLPKDTHQSTANKYISFL